MTAQFVTCEGSQIATSIDEKLCVGEIVFLGEAVRVRAHMREIPRKVWMPISEAASDALETPVEELPPLSNAIDLDGLDAIITNDRSHDVTVTFSYAGLRVLVHSSNTVYVRPVHGGDRDPL